MMPTHLKTIGLWCLLWGLACLLPPVAYGQSLSEICDNALDDDGNGLIDLLDPACDCAPIAPRSLIPNPSFEDTLCCPSSRSQMFCSDTWVQASEATTDFIHTCDWMGWEGLEVPLPIPDGDGCMGFRNGAYDASLALPNWKEYAGACLLSPLKAGVTYKFQFYVGFLSNVNSPTLDITFFGTPSCDYLPFGVGDDAFGCPTNGPDWIELGKVRLSGSNGWVQAEIQATPTQDIAAIAIGPDCLRYTYMNSIYYFLDNLTLNEASAFGFEIKASDQLCAEGVALSVPSLPGLAYQWYLDGVALVGETRFELSQMYGPGEYQMRSTDIDGVCGLSDPFSFSPPESRRRIDTVICTDEAIWFGGNWQYQTGNYLDTLKTAENCDSIVELNLEIFEHQPGVTNVKIWPGEQYLMGHARLSEPGWHKVKMVSRSGCDSIAIVNLKFLQFFAPSAFSPNDDGVNDRYYIEGGVDVQTLGLQIFNRWGRLVYEGAAQEPGSGWDGRINGQPAPEGVYMYRAQVRFVDDVIRERSGSLTLLR